jgi:hypothetical protein
MIGTEDSITRPMLVALGLFFLKERRVWWKRVLALWPFYLPSIFAIVFYLGVVVEPRCGGARGK